MLSASILFSASALANVEATDPYAMVKDVASKTFDRIKREQQDIKQDPEKLRKVMEEELLPYIDYKFAAFMVLGKHFRSVPEDKLGEYVQVFREYLITSYAIAMGYYDDQEVLFEPSGEWDDKKTVTVRALIKDDDRPDIKVAFMVRKNKKSDEWRAYDMVAEGISLISSKRSEFESILRQDGIEKVIAIMRDTIEKPIVLQAKES
ncbi:MlaC/ttg2D family ABC transporter substrate-binding protein [Alteromonas flava]|uniref:MlaC/ttg2D family ABC transporter substrate-binding protein n=1 Tax=Alteromonas flava TaxID=2048003 RepID=UPI001F0BC1FF|nr:ABC transporter substrate-binding protein [Alteromonas flava]